MRCCIRLILKQNAEAFLLEVVIIGEHIGEPFAPYDLHRDAVRQAILFILAAFIEVRPIEKRCLRRGEYVHVRIVKNASGSLGCALPCRCTGSTVESKKFCQNPFRGDEQSISKRSADCHYLAIPLFTPIEKSNPVECVREDRRHTDRLGTP